MLPEVHTSPLSESHLLICTLSPEKSLEDVIASIGKGLYLVDLDGLHSGFNPISGDFSLGTKGYLIKDGKIAVRLTR